MKFVSAIMPTRARPELVVRALDCFFAQTYPHRELIILDDSDAPSFPASVARLDGISYLRIDERLTIAEKRNRCCQMASGDVIMHWDDDDWSSPQRMMAQIALLNHFGKSVTAFHSMLFYDDLRARAVKYVGDRSYAIGTSLTYTHDWWERHPFRNGPNNPNVGEDGLFHKEALNLGELYSVDAEALMVATVHAGNTSVRDIDKPGQTSYRPVSLNAIPAEFFSA